MPTKWWRTLVRCLPLCVRVVVYVLYVHTMWCMCALCMWCGHMQSCVIIPLIELWGWPCRKGWKVCVSMNSWGSPGRKGWEVCVCISFHCHMQCSWPFRKLQEQMLCRLAFKTRENATFIILHKLLWPWKRVTGTKPKMYLKNLIEVIWSSCSYKYLALTSEKCQHGRFLYREETNQIFPSNPHSITESIACIGTSVYYI